MKRRNFLKTAALGGLAFLFSGCLPRNKTHILTLSFDDGLRKSFYKIAEIYEKFGLKACLNIIASAHTWKEEWPGLDYLKAFGDFDDWNELKRRGHEIMPHSWAHVNLAQISFDEAVMLIDSCLDYFEQHLEGFDSSRAVYNFAYNASNPELDAYVLTRVRALRTAARSVLDKTKINSFPDVSGPFRLGCDSYGPDNAEQWVDKEVGDFLGSPGGWRILNLHGLDGQGWGPVGSKYLEELLEMLVDIDYLDILPTGRVLEKYAF